MISATLVSCRFLETDECAIIFTLSAFRADRRSPGDRAFHSGLFPGHQRLSNVRCAFFPGACSVASSSMVLQIMSVRESRRILNEAIEPVDP
jgi:hypothetical protein